MSIPLEQKSFACYSTEQHGWLAEQRDYEIMVRASSQDIRLRGEYKKVDSHLISDR